MVSSPDTIANLHAAFRDGQLTPSELLELCFTRIDSREADVHAWVLVDRDGAMRKAEEQTRLLGRFGGEPFPPLFGIPVAIKDIFDVALWPTKAGSPLREQHLAESDAPVVTRLREAGAILLGKTVTTEFASFDPSPTHNPWHLERTPGGSSSGSAAAVACRMCVAALASQTGGSIVRPASYCGVVGFKPGYGIVPTDGVVPLAPSIDHVGAMARNVADAARVFGVISGASASGGRKSPGESPGESPIRFGILRDFFCDQADVESVAVFDAAMVHLENALGPAGAVDLGCDIAEVHRSHRVIMAFECAAYHRTWFASRRDQYGPQITKLIDEGLATSPDVYAKALDHANRFRDSVVKVLSSYDVLAMPSTHGPAPLLETTGDPRWQNVWSFARLPAITIPCGFAALNLPLGLQLVGADDLNVLDIAAQCEQELNLSGEIDRLLG